MYINSITQNRGTCVGCYIHVLPSRPFLTLNNERFSNVLQKSELVDLAQVVLFHLNSTN